MNRIPFGLIFNCTASLCGNIMAILPRFIIRDESMFLGFECLWVADARDYGQFYINDMNFDLDLSAFPNRDYLYTGKPLLFSPVTYFSFDDKWEAPDFERLRQENRGGF